MSAILLHLHGPMQSWGGPARFNQRTTVQSPTKSAIVGLLAAASGRKRGTDISDLAALAMTVRVDRAGRLLRDYHTVGAEYPKGQRLQNAEGKEKTDALVTERYYLADAAFTVVMSGDTRLIDQLDQALRTPRWALALGRRSCPPAEPFYLGVVHDDPVTLLEEVLPVARRTSSNDRLVRFKSDDPAGDRSPVPDQPASVLNRWDDYRGRCLRSWSVEMPAERFATDSFGLVEALRVA